MSGYSQNVKSKFGGFFKSLFGKGAAVETAIDIAVDTAPPPAQNYSSHPNGNGHSYADGDNQDVSHSFKNGNHPNNGGGNNGTAIAISLQTIICAMQPELRSRVRSAVPQDLTIDIAIEKVLPQLSHGVVKIPFGDIRKSAPHVFAPSPDADQLSVSLPLSSVLPHIQPSMMVRRTAQKQTKISEDIVGPFGAGIQGVRIANDKLVTPPTPAAPAAPSMLRRPTTPPPASPATTFHRAPVRQNISSVPTPPVVPTTPLPPAPAIPLSRPAPIAAAPAPVQAPAPAPITPIAPVIPMAPIARAPITPIAPEPAPVPAPVAAAPIAPTPITPIAPAPVVAAEPAPIPMIPIAPVAPVVPAAPAAPVNEAPPLMVPLGALAENWPDSLKQEIIRLNLGEAQLALPTNLIENGLKRGRIAFPWKTIQSWIRPAPLPSVSANDSLEVELPLKVIAPLFIARRKSATAAQQKLAMDESIPNLFFGFPQASAPAAVPAPVAAARVAPTIAPPAPAVAEAAPAVAEVAPAPKPADTNYFAWNEAPEAPAIEDQGIEFKRKPVASTDFTSRKATPQEIINRAAALEGVVGALIALPDGLKVASHIPADLNGDTLAAFLPQLFNKMSQCTRELRMGELNNLNFTVGNVPWKIFRVNAVFFAAFGRPGQSLPTAQLVTLAGELDRKNK